LGLSGFEMKAGKLRGAAVIIAEQPPLLKKRKQSASETGWDEGQTAAGGLDAGDQLFAARPFVVFGQGIQNFDSKHAHGKHSQQYQEHHIKPHHFHFLLSGTGIPV